MMIAFSVRLLLEQSQQWMRGQMSNENDAEYQSMLPFVVTKSNGGTLDDTSFVIGMELGTLYAELHQCQSMPQGVRATPGARYVHTEGLKQLDLIAMHHGFTITKEDTDDSGEWTLVSFKS